MKRIILLALFGMLSFTTFAQDWKANFEEAKAEAKAQNKRIVLVFSGSDWCAPCIKLDRNVWQSEEFKKYSAENYVLYRADFPKKKANQLPEELKNQNNALAEKYNQDGNYPLVVLLDANGKVLGMLGYLNLSASDYIAKMITLEKK